MNDGAAAAGDPGDRRADVVVRDDVVAPHGVSVPASSPPGEPVRVLAVCTANISRSPAVERLLRRHLGDAVQVGSAGVIALVGEPIDPPVADWLRARSAETAGFAARQLDEEMVRAADLVLALTREHRSRVLGLVPAAVRRTFTLRELARVVTSLDLTDLPTSLPEGDRLRAVIQRAIVGRALAPRAAEGGDDVPDPYGYGPEAYARSLNLIEQAVAVITGRR